VYKPNPNKDPREMTPRAEAWFTLYMLPFFLAFAAYCWKVVFENPFDLVGTSIGAGFALVFTTCAGIPAYRLWKFSRTIIIEDVKEFSESRGLTTWAGRLLKVGIGAVFITGVVMGIQIMSEAENTSAFVVGLILTIAGFSGLTSLIRRIQKIGF